MAWVEGCSLPDLVGVAARAAAEIILETGDVRRFSEAGFARFTGRNPCPLPPEKAAGNPFGTASAEAAIDDSTAHCTASP